MWDHIYEIYGSVYALGHIYGLMELYLISWSVIEASISLNVDDIFLEFVITWYSRVWPTIQRYQQ